jgi:hypothetical protein
MTRNRWKLAAVAALTAVCAVPATAQRGPAPAGTGLPADVLAVACGPKPVFEIPDQSLRVTGGQDSQARRVYGPGDLVTINGGYENGIEVGQEYYVRRVQVNDRQAISRRTPGNVRTAGWLRIYATDPRMSLATVTHACDTIDVNDYLEPFALPVVPEAVKTNAKPQKGNYGRIMFGSDRRRSFGKGDFFIIDRGSDHGVTPGSRFVVYRDRQLGFYGEKQKGMYGDRPTSAERDGDMVDNFLYDMGEAVVLEVRPDTSTLQVITSRDAFMSGDYVAIRK